MLIICLALAFAASLTTSFTTDAKAQPAFAAWYDADSVGIFYTVSETGVAGSFEVTFDTIGYIGAEFEADTLILVVAPPEADTGLVHIYCRGQGAGSVTIKFYVLGETTVLAQFQLCFQNDVSLNISPYDCGYPGPTLTEWGLIIFAGLFILTLIFVIRRKRVKLPTPA